MQTLDETSSQLSPPNQRKPLRLWPGVLAAALQWLAWLVVPRLVPEVGIFGALAALAFGLMVLLWWVFFSRAAWLERVGAIGVMAVALFATARVVHPSIATGMMGLMLVFYAVPVLSLALVGWAVATRRLSDGLRRLSLLIAIVLVCGGFTLLRTDGIDGDGRSNFRWRWSLSPEQRLLAQGEAGAGAAKPSAKAVKAGAEWPGFRGPTRDSVVRGVRIDSDWVRTPPVLLWRQPVGPGWSSFAVSGDVFYTQEQRGEEEVVACFKLATGEPVWRHRDRARFWESNAGAGPRATPTLSNGRVFALGATGILNVLDAASGQVVWSRNVAEDASARTPIWGFSGSPIVVDDSVIVAASGRLAAYDLNTGKPRWLGPAHGGSYSSPHLVRLGAVSQVLLLSDAGVTSVAPADGKVLWEYAWRGAAIVQPTVIADGDLLVSTGGPSGGLGLRRLSVTEGTNGWNVALRWNSNGLKPYFNDSVVHKGHVYGFDGSMLACIELEGGKRQWKDGRYGSGQLLLLPDQDLLLVVAEKGELVLVNASSEPFQERARFPAIKGKTWNHPVLAGDVLLVRNAEEMAAFRLALVNP
jgi:outer membrane protein assembly factor BamB